MILVCFQLVVRAERTEPIDRPANPYGLSQREMVSRAVPNIKSDRPAETRDFFVDLEQGFEIAYSLRDEEWGVRRFMLREPSGTVVNVLSHLAR
jgi:hypothetical protein